GQVDHAVREDDVHGGIGHGQVLDLAQRSSTFGASTFWAFSRALAIISGVMSTPMTLPVLPTRLAARKQSKPAPLPRSSTVSPGSSAAIAWGFPQPSPRSAPSGAAFRSSSV